MFWNKQNWFERKYEQNFKWVYGYVFIRIGNHAQTEDLVSEIWENAYKGLDSLKSHNNSVFCVWLFRIVRNVLAKYFSNNKKTETIDLAKVELIADDDFEEGFDNSKLFFDVRGLMNSLPEAQKETLYLRYISEFSNKEIAANLNVSEKTVSSNLARALAFLRDHLTKSNPNHLSYE